MIKDDCIFCKIANGAIPSATIYEDDDFRVILDIAPAAKGHALILPKQHYANLWELGEEEAKKVMAVAAKVSAAQKQRSPVTVSTFYKTTGWQQDRPYSISIFISFQDMIMTK